MKTTISISTLAITLSSFMPLSGTGVVPSYDKVGREALEAFRHGSISEYQQLFPKLKDFYELMDADAAVYGKTLEAAKRDFARVYLEQIYPALSMSFEQIVKEGKARGIDWSAAKFDHVECSSVPSGKFGHSSLNIIFTTNGASHTITIEKALIINGEWKVSQFAKLI